MFEKVFLMLCITKNKIINLLNAGSVKRFKSSSTIMKVFTQKKNPISGVSEWDLQHEDYDYHQEIARAAFADMLHDTERNQKYYSALRKAIRKMHQDGKKANVLDIGTGTGLLSIMAARLGADSIIACEAFKPMAECCQKILYKNNVAHLIKLVPKRSTELTVGVNGDLPERANILVTEVFDTELIGEGAIPTFTHAHKHLLTEDCIVVPDSAVVYAQVVECPQLWKWNKLNDLYDEDMNLILRVPDKMRACAGAAAVHDVQLSQLPRAAFTELSPPLPVLRYDWTPRAGLDRAGLDRAGLDRAGLDRAGLDRDRREMLRFMSTGDGAAQVVFMWWELNMDPEGDILLSCAPWWAHPDADVSAERPQDTIPWRDHWMQAVYYLPTPAAVHRQQELTLVSCQDEYSLWFYLETEKKEKEDYKRPVCECGVHMAYSRTHVAYLNDGRRSKKFLSYLREELNGDSVVLDLNGSSLMGLAAARMGAKTVYVHESAKLNCDILRDYAAANAIDNVRLVGDLDEISDLSDVTHVICDPGLASAILPWDNLRIAYVLYKYREKLSQVSVVPQWVEFWALPVEFRDLQKIRVPLKTCEGVDVTIFDKLVEESRGISDDELEPQPLWEYPCGARGPPRRLLTLRLDDLTAIRAVDGEFMFDDANPESLQVVNGFAVWSVWGRGAAGVSAGPRAAATPGGPLDWDPHTRQAVKILKQTHHKTGADRWGFQLAYDLEKGVFDLNINL